MLAFIKIKKHQYNNILNAFYNLKDRLELSLDCVCSNNNGELFKE